MEIIIKDYPDRVFPQDLKWFVTKQGYKYISSEQVSPSEVRLYFISESEIN